MNFRTLVELPHHEIVIKHSDQIILFGSCFAENIGRKLSENKFRCDINPFGILYNPMSILQALNEICSNKTYTSNELILYGENWHSFMHHSSFSDISQEICLQSINERLQRTSEGLLQADYLMITFGSAYVYTLKLSSEIVGNCHKLPESDFERRLLTVDEIVSGYSGLILKTERVNPKMKWLFTVSPIRHTKNGMHGNQISKSVLLLAVERLKTLFPSQVFYFPAYELMMDELRDYRFYADDMLHPSVRAVEYIWECFVKSYFPDETNNFIREWEQIMKALNHKPFDPGSENYKSFLMQNVLRIERVKEKYPYLDVQKELEICRIRLR